MTFVFQNICLVTLFVFKLLICFYVLMDYTLNDNFKRRLVIDAIDSTRYGNMSVKEWSAQYVFSQEVLFPGEIDYVKKATRFLGDARFRFDPHMNSHLVDLAMKWVEIY